MNQNEIAVMYDAAQLAERREQRRYELVKTIIGAWESTGSTQTMTEAASGALEFADIILAALDHPK